MPSVFLKRCPLINPATVLVSSLCLLLCQNTYANTAQEIVESLHEVQSEYVLFKHGSKNEDPMASLDMDLYRISERANGLLADSYHYIKDNYHNQNGEYARVAGIAKRLNNFHKIKLNLVDSGCLSSESENVRKLSLGILEKSLSVAVIQEDCEEDEGTHTADAFVQDLDNALYCLRNVSLGGECDKKEPHEKGMFGYDGNEKLKMIEDILKHRTKLNQNSRIFLDYVFTGRCNDNEEICISARRNFPEMADGQGAFIDRVNQQLESFNSGSQNEEDFRVNMTNLLRFSKTGLERCVPQIYDYFQNLSPKPEFEILRFYEYFQDRSSKPQFQPLTTEDFNCMYTVTKNLLEEDSQKRERKLRDSIAHTQENLDSLSRHTSARNARRVESANGDINDGLKQTILYDPIAFSSYLVSDGSDDDFVNLCNTIKEIAKNIEDEEFLYNATFTGINIGALVLIGAGIVASGPLSAAVAVAASSIAVVDGILYWIKEKKYQKKADSSDRIATELRFMQGLNDEIAYDIFKNEMEDRLRHIRNRNSSSDWKYFAFVSAALSGAGIAVGVTSQHLLHATGGLSRLGRSVVGHIAKGGKPGRDMADALAKAAEIGEHAVVDFMHALSKPEQFNRLIVQAANSHRFHTISSKGHNALEFVHKATNPLERTSVAYWARSYSRSTLTTMSRALRTAPRGAHSTREGLGYADTVYQDLEEQINGE